MLWRKKSIIRGQGRVLDVEEDGKSEITLACFCSLLTLHAALEELLRDIPTQCPCLHKPIAWTQEDREGDPHHPFSPSIDRIDNNKGLCLRFVVAAAALLIFCCRLRQGQRLDCQPSCQQHQEFSKCARAGYDCSGFASARRLKLPSTNAQHARAHNAVKSIYCRREVFAQKLH
jgi:hypothetical protein